MSHHAAVFSKEDLAKLLIVFSKAPIVYQTKDLIWFSYLKDGFFEKYSNSWRRMHLELADNGMYLYMYMYGCISLSCV